MLDCQYMHATAHTSVGHATIMSGLFPQHHGIIANYWFDRKENKAIYSVEDTLYPLVNLKQRSKSEGRSPKQLTGPNFADDWREFTNGKARVFSVSNKDRSAILMGGKKPNGVFWGKDYQGGMYTSRYYTDDLSDWIKSYNESNPSDKWLDKEWKTFLDQKYYPDPDTALFPHFWVPRGFEKQFPHRILSHNGKPDSNYYDARLSSPYGLEELTSFTLQLLEKEKLGSGEATDLLLMSYSSTDYVGHSFGCNSAEMMDMVIRTDQELLKLISSINRKVGEENVFYILTSDHGIGLMPEEAVRLGFDAERVSPSALAKEINKSMSERFGSLSESQKYINISYPDIYLNNKVLEEKKIDKNVAQEYITALLMKKVFVGRVFKSNELQNEISSEDWIAKAVQRSYKLEHSGDMVVVLKPHYVWDSDNFGAAHSLPYDYDTSVPLVFTGANWIMPGNYEKKCSPADIVPTLARILGAPKKNWDGQALDEILRNK